MTLWVLLIVFVVTAVAGVIAVKIVEHRFTSDIDESLHKTSLGAKTAFTILSNEQIEEFSKDAELRSITDRDRALMILSADGVDVSFPSGSLEDPDPLPDVTSIGFDQLRSRAEEIFELPSEGGAPAYRVLVSQLDDGRLLVVAAPTAPLHDALRTVASVLLLVAIIGSIVMAVIVSLVTGYVTRPLEGMITTAQGIGSGDLDTRIPVRGVDDVAKLSSALNAMLDRLELAFADKEASEEKLRQFVADASHELRTPLSAVLGYAQLVQTGMASTPDQVDHAVGRIAAEGERMRLMVEELLMLARLDHGRAANPTRVNLADIAQVAVDDARAIVPDRSVALHRGDVEPAALDVLADAPTVR
jgi:signal transduction histidine kinase